MELVQEQRAQRTEQIAPHLEHWWLDDERIGGRRSDSYSLWSTSGFVFVDPLPLTYAAADKFPVVGVVFLTCACHQRAAWRYQYEHAARVLAPRGSPGLRTEPDQHYVEGTTLPAEFKAIHTPGPEYNHYALHRPGDLSVLFVGELVHRPAGEGPLQLSPIDPALDPEIGRRSVEKLLELDFDVLCLSHGGYIDFEAQLALADVLERPA